MIFELYTTKNPMSTVGSQSLASFYNWFTLGIYCKQKETNNISYRFDKMIIELNIPKTPCQSLDGSL